MSVLGEFIGKKRKAFWEYLESWQSAVYSMIVLGATMVVIFWASVFLYTSFYFTFIPQESIIWPIHFQYKSCNEEPGICSYPKAVVSVNDKVRGSQLVRGQRYRVVVDMEMPESITNQQLGMFLVSMDMRSVGGEMLRHSSRSAMLHYKSPLLHFISTFVFAPFLLYGLQEEKQIITIELFSQYEEDPLNPLWEVGVELESRHVELYSASLRIHAMFTGLRYIMYHYPIIAATVGIGICMVFLSTVVILSWYQFSGPVLFVQPQSRSFPNGHPPNQESHQPKSSVEYKAESEEKKSEPDKTTGSANTGASDKENGAGERRESEDFEVLSSSKVQGENEKRIRFEDSEDGNGDCTLRHRVQSIVQIPPHQMPASS